MGKLIWDANLHIAKLFLSSIWRDALQDWANYNHVSLFNGNEVLEQLLWYDSNILKEGLPIVKSLISEHNEWKTYAEIVQEFGPCLSWLEYCQLIVSIPNIWWYLVTTENTGNIKSVLTVKDTC